MKGGGGADVKVFVSFEKTVSARHAARVRAWKRVGVRVAGVGGRMHNTQAPHRPVAKALPVHRRRRGRERQRGGAAERPAGTRSAALAGR